MKDIKQTLIDASYHIDTLLEKIECKLTAEQGLSVKTWNFVSSPFTNNIALKKRPILETLRNSLIRIKEKLEGADNTNIFSVLTDNDLYNIFDELLKCVDNAYNDYRKLETDQNL